jgi:uncharacterized protein YcbK (DUF882 family)
MSISISVILMNRIKYDELPADQKASLKQLHAALFDLETAWLSHGGKPFKVSSGYRTPDANAAAGGAKKSLHMVCKACDISDPDGALDAWCTANQDLLQKLGLWQEHPDSTKNWTHLDIGTRPTINRLNCGKRQFKP